MVTCLAIAMSLKVWKTERPFMSRNKHGQTFRSTGTLGWAMQQFDSLRYNRLSTTLPLFVSGTTLSNQLCVECGNITLPLQGTYKFLTQTTSKGSLLRKGCQNCQNPKLLGQSLIQEQWHRKPQPICGCVWGLGCSTNKGAVAHTTNHISTTPLAQDSARTAQPSAATFGLKWACMAGTCGCIGCNPKPCL